MLRRRRRLAALLLAAAALLACAGAPGAAAAASENPYRVLGVARTASQGEVRAAYKRLVKELHPDKRRDGAAQEDGDDAAFVRVQQAYETLSSPRKRREYDQGGASSGSASGSRRSTWRGNQYQALRDYHELRDVLDPVSVRLRASNFDLHVEFGKPHDEGAAEVWVVLFYSSYCPVCESVKPAWREFTGAADGLLRTGTVHTDYEPELARRLGVRRVPTVLGFRSRGGRIERRRSMDGSARDASAIAAFALSLMPQARDRSADLRVRPDRVGARVSLPEGRQSPRARLLLRVLRASGLGDTMTFQPAPDAAAASSPRPVVTVLSPDGEVRAEVPVEPAHTLPRRLAAHRLPAVPRLHGGNWWEQCFKPRRPCLVRLVRGHRAGASPPRLDVDADEAGARLGWINCDAQRRLCRTFGDHTVFALVRPREQKVLEFAGKRAPDASEVHAATAEGSTRWRRVRSGVPFPVVEEAPGRSSGRRSSLLYQFGLDGLSDWAGTVLSSGGALFFIIMLMGQLALR